MKLVKSLTLGSLLLASSMFAESFEIDKPHSSVGFKAKHLVVATVNGNFNSFDGSIEFDYATKQLESIKGTIAVKSVDTDNKKRDKHLKSSDFFNASKFPKITFTSTKVEGDNVWGDLTIKGITKNAKFELEDVATIIGPKGNKRIGFALSSKINRFDYGLKWNKALEAGGAIVSKDIKLIIELEGIAK